MYDNRFNPLILYFKTIKYYANIKMEITPLGISAKEVYINFINISLIFQIYKTYLLINVIFLKKIFITSIL